ncbi:2013_t:CDS:10 [Paraglomus brasilianum]|uniref:Condensin complex subunit 1 n=1 Tax=Paraglomus brasilianum TaxID=144538 RepID=A0A9N8WH96_9GLOM|nr:2013_t:CDS:10 [Paraglomus brasilianum]
MEEFALSEELEKLQEENYYLKTLANLREADLIQISRELQSCLEKVEEDPQNIFNTQLFARLKSITKKFSNLKPPQISQLINIIITGLATECENTSGDLQANDDQTFDSHRQALNMWSFLLGWATYLAENKAQSKQNQKETGEFTSRSGRRGKERNNEPSQWNWDEQRKATLTVMVNVLKLNLESIWVMKQELETFVGIFTKTVFLILESPLNIKDQSTKMHLFEILAISTKNYKQTFAIKTSILQHLRYYEHMPEPTAELLGYLHNKYTYTQLTDDILMEIGDADLSVQDKTGPKQFSKFLVRLSEVAASLVLRQLVHVMKHMDSPVGPMRVAVIEITGNLIEHLANRDEQTESDKETLNNLFNILKQRSLDLNGFVRAKVMQACIKICDLKAKFPKARQHLVDRAIQCLKDKSVIVRKYAIQALAKFIRTHPFGMVYGGELRSQPWKDGLAKINEDSSSIEPPEELSHITQESPPSSPLADAQSSRPSSPSPISSNVSPEYYEKLNLTKRYYADALRFIESLSTAIPTLFQLLDSINKSEVIETMEFFVAAYQYKLDRAEEGLTKMLHLIWSRETDEGKSVKKKLIECYQNVYISTGEGAAEIERVEQTVRNLVRLADTTSVAKLTSLEELFSTMMSTELISPEVIERLWTVYAASNSQTSAKERRGAMMVLASLAKAKKEIISEKLNVLRNIGLSSAGRQDLVLARYTCIALQRLAGEAKIKGSPRDESTRLPVSHPIFEDLRNILEIHTNSNQWYPLAEQAINAIYVLCNNPDILCGEIIKQKTIFVFKLDDDSFRDEPSTSEPVTVNTTQLSQLLFIVGHVTLKQLVHLETIEAEWKRRKQSGETKDKNHVEDELDQIVGTTEDEFSEMITQIREYELLYGANSLLGEFGGLVAKICANRKVFNDNMLQFSATLALAKFMCVSSQYCETYLPLLFNVLEKSNDDTLRCNIIIALGDLVVLFNNIIDPEINVLYELLADESLEIKRNALMVLTHLILNGMIKTRGQLGEMAKCVADENSRISNLAGQFFTELAKKENAVYNNLPDIISNLSRGENAVDEDSFKRIMKFLFRFIEKDKHSENVIEKLCQRFKNLDDKRQWRDIAYCLSQLQYKHDGSVRRLVEGFPNYQDKLQDTDVLKHFREIVNKLKARKEQSTEMKQFIEEYEAKVKACEVTS